MATKLSEQEIETLKAFQQKTQGVILDLGKIELQLKDLTELKRQVMEVMDQLIKEQNEFFRTIEETYGKGQIDLENFAFVPADYEQLPDELD
jgi:hypothetical protein